MRLSCETDVFAPIDDELLLGLIAVVVVGVVAVAPVTAAVILVAEVESILGAESETKLRGVNSSAFGLSL